MDEIKEVVITEAAETALVVKENPETQITTSAPTMWNNSELMKSSYQVATILSKTAAIPDRYKNKPGDCLILIDLSNRMGISPIVVAQWSQIVKGNFTWAGQACKALIDNCGKYRNSKYEMFGEPGTSERGCVLTAIKRSTGEIIKGPEVTMKIAKDEGWIDKDGSKWKTMPELMLRYRAAAFFARTECPEALMGFYTSEEMNDIKGYEPEIAS